MLIGLEAEKRYEVKTWEEMEEEKRLRFLKFGEKYKKKEKPKVVRWGGRPLRKIIRTPAFIELEKKSIELQKKSRKYKKDYIEKHGWTAWTKTPQYKKILQGAKIAEAERKRVLEEFRKKKEKQEKRRRKRKKLHKVIKGVGVGLAALPFAIALAPVVGPAISAGAKVVGGGLAKVKTLISSGAKILGKTAIKTGVGLVKTAAKAVILEQASGLITKVPLSQAEEEVVETIQEHEIKPAVSQGIDLYEIEQALKQNIFPSEIIQIAEEKHIPVKDAFLPEQIQEIKQEKKKKQLNDIIPLVLGGGSLIASLI